jgi:hypothetical protein
MEVLSAVKRKRIGWGWVGVVLVVAVVVCASWLAAMTASWTRRRG